MREDFRLFKIGRMRTLVHTGTYFDKVEFSRESIPLSFWKNENTLDAKFEIAPDALPYAEEWLGVENIRQEENRLIAEVTLPDDEALTGKILSAGAGFKVIYPPALKERVKAEAEKLSKLYA